MAAQGPHRKARGHTHAEWLHPLQTKARRHTRWRSMPSASSSSPEPFAAAIACPDSVACSLRKHQENPARAPGHTSGANECCDFPKTLDYTHNNLYLARASLTA